jgi:hypothetical protein
MSANHANAQVLIDGQIITVLRGSFITSELKLATRWGWARKTVHNFLGVLKKDKMVTTIATTKYTAITLINYGLYQDTGTTIDTSKGQENIQLGCKTLPTNNNSINEKNKYSPEFEKFWLAYPKKDEKTKAYRTWQSRIKEKVDPQLLITAACNYAAVVAGKETTFIKLAATFLGRDRHYEEFASARQSTVKSNTITKAEADAMDGFEYLKFIENGGEVG